jgi:ubiquinone/menaquinone biosynthesis C-methylase UbiE
MNMSSSNKAMPAIYTPVEGFDEATYLRLNPDVRDAVQHKAFSSGWQHYILHGMLENRQGVSAGALAKTRAMLDGRRRAVPPDHLRRRVHGDESIAGFTGVGMEVARDIYLALDGRIELGAQSRILDFGCGCGRVIQELHDFFSESSFSGTDIDGEAIAWCQKNIPQIGEFLTNGNMPPLPFQDEFFDLVYSISVFTHLPEDMQFAWLDELRRVTRRSGLLVLTVHGEELLARGAAAGKRRLQKTGFYYEVGRGTPGLPDFYQVAYHTETYIRKHWSKYFEIKEIVKKGIQNHQDLILCQRRD